MRVLFSTNVSGGEVDFRSRLLTVGIALLTALACLVLLGLAIGSADDNFVTAESGGVTTATSLTPLLAAVPISDTGAAPAPVSTSTSTSTSTTNLTTAASPSVAVVVETVTSTTITPVEEKAPPPSSGPVRDEAPERVDNQRDANPSPPVTEPATRVTEPATRVTEPATRVTEPATRVTEPATRVTEPATRVTEPATRVTEPVTRVTRSVPPSTQAYANVVALDAFGQPVSGVTVTHGPVSGESTIAGVTNEDGWSKVRVPPGCRVSRLEAPAGMLFKEQQAMAYDHSWCADPGEWVVLTVSMQRANADLFTVEAVLSDGTPIAGVKVTLLAQTRQRAVTGADGKAQVELRPFFECWDMWYVAPEGYLMKEGRSNDGWGERRCKSDARVVQVTLVDAATVLPGTLEVLTGYRDFFVGDQDPNAAISGVSIDVPGQPEASAATDTNGRLSMEVPAGCYDVRFKAHGAVDSSGEGDLVFGPLGIAVDRQSVESEVCVLRGETKTVRVALSRD